jgi:hypothetical protein
MGESSFTYVLFTKQTRNFVACMKHKLKFLSTIGSAFCIWVQSAIWFAIMHGVVLVSYPLDQMADDTEAQFQQVPTDPTEESQCRNSIPRSHAM